MRDSERSRQAFAPVRRRGEPASYSEVASGLCSAALLILLAAATGAGIVAAVLTLKRLDLH